jgi:hypothetical protein
MSELEELDALYTSIGIPIYNEEFCTWLLAFFGVYGNELGEQVIQREAFRQVLHIAQKKLNIEGGKISTHVKELQEAMSEFKRGTAIADAWKITFLTRYKLLLE